MFLGVVSIFSLFSLIGCTQNAVYQVSEYNFSQKIILHKNKTFVTHIYLNTDYDTIYGTWHTKRDTLCLYPDTSFILIYCDPRSRVEEFYNAEADSTLIQIFANEKPFLSRVFINNDRQNGDLTDSEGVLWLSDTIKIETIAANSLACHTVEHRVQSSKSNVFKIYVYDWVNEPRWTRYNFTYRYKIKNRKLIPIRESEVDYFLKKKLWSK